MNSKLEYKLVQEGKFRIKFYLWNFQSLEWDEYMIKNRSIDEINTYLETYGYDDYFKDNWIEPRLNLWEIM